MVAHDQPAAEAAIDPHCLQGSSLNVRFKILFNTDFGFAFDIPPSFLRIIEANSKDSDENVYVHAGHTDAHSLMDLVSRNLILWHANKKGRRPACISAMCCQH